MHDGLKEKR